MNAPHIDAQAREIALTRFALPLCLHIPIAARDEDALERFVGQIETILPSGRHKVVILRAYDPPEADARLPIWEQPEAAILRARRQLWVDVDTRAYRRAYAT